MIRIGELDYEKMKGQTYSAEIRSDRYLSIEPQAEGFRLEWVSSDTELVMHLGDEILSDWLEEPQAYGAYEAGKLVGFTEGFLEKWNNRYRIANICVFEPEMRGKGIGGLLLERITEAAKASGARMIVLETQSFNAKAISFYKKNGFGIIGFDRYAYSNNGPQEKNMRIEMGKKL